MGVLHLISFRELYDCGLDGVAQFSLFFVWLGGCVFRRSGIVWTGSLGFMSPGCLLFGGGGTFRDALYNLQLLDCNFVPMLSL